MTRPRPFLLLSLLAFVALAIAACATERKPIRGFDKPPPGTIVLDADPGGTVVIWPIFAGTDGSQVFRARLNSQDAVIMSSQDGYDYLDWTMPGGWTGGWDNSLTGIPPGTYVVEIDSAGQSWGKSAPLAVPAGGGNRYDSTVQNPTVVFTHFDDQVGSWNIDPSTQDADPATDEITVTNLLGRRYAMYGVYAENAKGPYGGPATAEPVVERFLTPGYPRALRIGVGFSSF